MTSQIRTEAEWLSRSPKGATEGAAVGTCEQGSAPPSSGLSRLGFLGPQRPEPAAHSSQVSSKLHSRLLPPTRLCSVVWPPHSPWRPWPCHTAPFTPSSAASPCPGLPHFKGTGPPVPALALPLPSLPPSATSALLFPPQRAGQREGSGQGHWRADSSLFWSRHSGIIEKIRFVWIGPHRHR